MIYTQCCWDDDLKNGKWQVVHYKEIEENYSITDFWGTRALDGSYFKVTGETILTGKNWDGEKRITITENDIIGLEKYGVAPPEWIYDYYLERLKKEER